MVFVRVPDVWFERRWINAKRCTDTFKPAAFQCIDALKSNATLWFVLRNSLKIGRFATCSFILAQACTGELLGGEARAVSYPIDATVRVDATRVNASLDAFLTTDSETRDSATDILPSTDQYRCCTDATQPDRAEAAVPIVIDAATRDASRIDTYNPCPPAGTACRIMPLGDSITRGSDHGGYRSHLFSAMVRAGKNITFVGSEAHGPDTIEGRSFPKQHEGHSGWTIEDGGGRSGITSRVTGWVTAARPHIVLLMIGTNDLNIALDVPDAPRRLGIVLDRVASASPDALIILARIIPSKLPALNAVISTYNNAIESVAATRIAAGKHILVVDMEQAFLATPNYATACLGDDLHPSEIGYGVMSQVWMRAVQPVVR